LENESTMIECFRLIPLNASNNKLWLGFEFLLSAFALLSFVTFGILTNKSRLPVDGIRASDQDDRCNRHLHKPLLWMRLRIPLVAPLYSNLSFCTATSLPTFIVFQRKWATCQLSTTCHIPLFTEFSVLRPLPVYLMHLAQCNKGYSTLKLPLPSTRRSSYNSLL
jgi:hypothetical protein